MPSPILNRIVLIPSLDSVTLDYRNRILASGGAISDPSLKAIDAFVKGCKSDGTWNLLLDTCVFAGTSLNAALVKLKSPISQSLVNFNFIESDYNQNIGITGNGSTKYLNTQFKLITNGGNNSGSDNGLCVYVRTGGNGSTQIGARDWIIAQNFGGRTYYSGNPVNSSMNPNFADTTNLGFYSFSQVGSSLKFFRNGVVTATTTSMAQVDDSDIWVMGRSSSAGAIFQATNRIISFYAIKKGLTDAQEATFYNRVQSLQLALNRGV